MCRHLSDQILTIIYILKITSTLFHILNALCMYTKSQHFALAACCKFASYIANALLCSTRLLRDLHAVSCTEVPAKYRLHVAK